MNKQIVLMKILNLFNIFASPVQGERRYGRSRGRAVTRGGGFLQEAGQQRHTRFWDRRRPRPGDTHCHPGWNQQSQREGNVQRSAHPEVDHSGSGLLRRRRRAGWVRRERKVCRAEIYFIGSTIAAIYWMKFMTEIQMFHILFIGHLSGDRAVFNSHSFFACDTSTPSSFYLWSPRHILNVFLSFEYFLEVRRDETMQYCKIKKQVLE